MACHAIMLDSQWIWNRIHKSAAKHAALALSADVLRQKEVACDLLMWIHKLVCCSTHMFTTKYNRGRQDTLLTAGHIGTIMCGHIVVSPTLVRASSQRLLRHVLKHANSYCHSSELNNIQHQHTTLSPKCNT